MTPSIANVGTNYNRAHKPAHVDYSPKYALRKAPLEIIGTHSDTARDQHPIAYIEFIFHPQIYK